MSGDADRWKSRYERERKARKEAEQLLEEKSLELYKVNRSLERQARELEQSVIERTSRLAFNQQGLVDLNTVLVSLGDQLEASLGDLVASCGQILGAHAVLLSRSEGEGLVEVEKWQREAAPVAEIPSASPVCKASTRRESGLSVVVMPERLGEEGENPITEWNSNFQMAMGCSVQVQGDSWGALTAFYRDPKERDPFLEEILEMIANAIGGELERDKAREELGRAKEQAERGNEAKSMFLANLSHEIRTPLNGILGFAEVLSGSSLSERQKGSLDAIRASGEVLLHIINETLDLSRIEQGYIELSREEFSPESCLTEVIAILRPKADEFGIMLKTEIDEEVPGSFSGDLNRLRQVLINLVNNALKFTPEGQVVVRLLPEPVEPVGIRFEVADTGPGIAESELDHLFEPFTQFGEDVEKREGAGLGLAICRSLVKSMEGDIGCTSELGKGSCFWFTLPGKEVDRPTPGRIGLAIENPINRQLLATLAKGGGHEVETWDSLGAWVGDEVTAGSIDVLLADARALRLRADSDVWRSIPVIFLGEAPSGSIEPAPAGHLSLPLDPQEVLRVLAASGETPASNRD